MCVYRFRKPYTIFETESFIGQCTYGAYINHVAAEVAIDSFGDISRNFCMITPIQYTMYAIVGKLISHIGTTVAENATRHMQLDIRTDIFFLESTAGKFVTG